MASIVIPVEFSVRGRSARARALLDTGAEKTFMSEKIAKKIGAKLAGRVFIRGAGGGAAVRSARVDRIEITGSACSAGPMNVLVFSPRVFPLGGLTSLGAIIGLDFMKKARMEIAAFTRTNIVRCLKSRLAALLSETA